VDRVITQTLLEPAGFPGSAGDFIALTAAILVCCQTTGSF